ncbi:MAG: triose-phosphate isomerase [Paracoccaceae bacterium]|nr:triose-phosphate isomerase [Paracoccaceae bacterium]
MIRRPLIAGNWKMNGLSASAVEINAIADGAPNGVDLLICPPATLIASLANRGVPIGGQNCHSEVKGAYTGDVSADQLADVGAVAVIVGHSERRQEYEVTDAIVCSKVPAAWGAGLTAIICVGETKEQRDHGAALDVVGAQLAGSIPDGATAANSVIAYEPVWAIGTGLVSSINDITEMHAHIRAQLAGRFAEAEGMRILYGGSLKPDNAAEILAIENVDGGLIGGASLKAEDFLAIARAA